MKRRTRRQFLIEAGSVPIAVTVLGSCAEESTTGSTTTDVQNDSVGTNSASDTQIEPDQTAVEPPEEYEYDGELGPEGMFAHGVASGDPLATAVILWTRVQPPSGTESFDVFWEMATDTEFVDRVAAGTAPTGIERDYTVKVDAQNLAPGQSYYYQFWYLGQKSPMGRTRTAPEGDVSRLRFAVASCSNYSAGYFNAYRDIAAHSELDAVIHLGDYIYEYGSSGFIAERAHHPPKEIVAINDYRQRLGQYRMDEDLQEAHRQHPFITVWDDHEFANNSWSDGAQNHQPDKEGDWDKRKAVAMQAYNEWMPIRESQNGEIFRWFKYGDLVDLMMLDTRIYGRDEPVDKNDKKAIADPKRSILGDEQEAWLHDTLAESKALWRMIGQQVVLSPVTAAGAVINSDQWDGYSESRERFFEMLDAMSIDNLVVLTGDIHSSWAGDIPRDLTSYDPETGDGAVGVEFVTPGVTSGFPLNPQLVELAIQVNPHIKYGEVTSRGYMVIDVDKDRTEAIWYHYTDVKDRKNQAKEAAAFYTLVGDSHAREAEASTPAPKAKAEPAP